MSRRAMGFSAVSILFLLTLVIAGRNTGDAHSFSTSGHTVDCLRMAEHPT